MVRKVYCSGLVNRLRRLGCGPASLGPYADVLPNFRLNGLGFPAGFGFMSVSSHL